MGEFVLKNCKLVVDGKDLSCDLNEVTMTYSADVLDRTTFCSSARRRKAGLQDTQITGGGFTNMADEKNEPTVFPLVGSTNEVVTLVPNPSSGQPIVGDRAYHLKLITGDFAPGGSIGDMAAMNFSMMGDGMPARGEVMQRSTALSSSAVATIRVLGVRGPQVQLSLGVQVLSVSSSGAGLTLHLEQDSSTAFATTPSTAITLVLTDASANNGYFSSTAAGSTLDTSYRISVTNTAGTTDSSMDILATVGLTNQ